MISAFLLPLFLAGTQAGVGSAPSGDPPIRLWINNDGRFLRGDHAEVQVRTKDDGYLLVLHADPDGQVQILFPLDPDDDNFVRGGERYDVKGRGGREAFDIKDASGRGMVYAAASREPFRFEGYRLGNQWDYRALAPSPLPRDPELELTDLVRHMAPVDFDYDVLTYDVIERVVYASDYAPVPGDYAVSAGFFFRGPFRRLERPFRFAFDPFFFDPFLDPFVRQRIFFDPFFDPFVRPGLFFDPFLRRPFFPQPIFGDPFFRRPFFFTPRGLAPVPFRDRRTDFRRAAITADLTPGRARGAAIASRGRRLEFRSEEPVRRIVADVRQRAIEPRRNNWPIDVSPRRRELVTEGRRNNWPVDVSPRLREPVPQARRNNWPVDVSPRRWDPGPPTARRAGDDRGGVRPQIDGARMSEAHRAWRSEDRPGLGLVPNRGFARFAPRSFGSGPGVSRR